MTAKMKNSSFWDNSEPLRTAVLAVSPLLFLVLLFFMTSSHKMEIISVEHTQQSKETIPIVYTQMTSAFEYEQSQINPDKDWDVKVNVSYYEKAPSGRLFDDLYEVYTETYDSVSDAIEGNKNGMNLVYSGKATVVTYKTVSRLDHLFGKSEIKTMTIPNEVDEDTIRQAKSRSELRELYYNTNMDSTFEGETNGEAEFTLRYFYNISEGYKTVVNKKVEDTYKYKIQNGKVERVK